MSNPSTTAAPMLNQPTLANIVGSDIEADSDTALPASQLPMLVERNVSFRQACVTSADGA